MVFCRKNMLSSLGLEHYLTNLLTASATIKQIDKTWTFIKRIDLVCSHNSIANGWMCGAQDGDRVLGCSWSIEFMGGFE